MKIAHLEKTQYISIIQILQVVYTLKPLHTIGKVSVNASIQ